MTDTELLRAVVKRYHEKSRGRSSAYSFNDVAYEVVLELDPDDLPEVPNLGDEPGVLKFRNHRLVNKHALYFLDVNAVMAEYRNGFFLRPDVKAYLEENL